MIGATSLLILAFIVFLPVLQGKFIWDDHTLIVDNPIIKSPDGLKRFWFTTEPPDYFPLTSTTWWIEWRIWKMDPMGYHVDNILLHVASGVLIWRILRRLGTPAPWLCAAIFIVHPVNVESAAWISERKNTLSYALCLLAGLCYLRFDRHHKKVWLIAAVIAFTAALLSKTSVVAFPVILLAVAWYRRGKIDRRDLLISLPFFLIALTLALVTIWFQSHRAIGNDVVRNDGFASRLAVAGCAIWFYFYKALVPAHLAFVYPRWQLDLEDLAVYLPAAAVVAVFWVLWRFRARLGRGPLLAATYYLLMLLPILGFLNIYFMKYSFVSDHWQYPAIIGVIVPAVTVGKWFISRITRPKSKNTSP